MKCQRKQGNDKSSKREEECTGDAAALPLGGRAICDEVTPDGARGCGHHAFNNNVTNEVAGYDTIPINVRVRVCSLSNGYLPFDADCQIFQLVPRVGLPITWNYVLNVACR